MTGRDGRAWLCLSPYRRRNESLIVSGTLWACALIGSKIYTPPNLHKVGKNETFASISRRYKTGFQTLMEANPSIHPERLKPGAVIVIPGRIKATPKPLGAGHCKIQNGDTDWSIARRYGIKPSELRAMNPGVKWTTIQPGAVINVPQRSETVVATKNGDFSMKVASNVKKPVKLGKHKVAEEENDWIIARAYGITPKQLHSINPGVNWNKLRPGTPINVPAKTSMVAAITTKRAKIARDNVIVRSGARTNSSRVAMVEIGRIASVADRIGSWYKLKFDGGTVGWVRGDLLKPVTASMLASVRRVAKPTIRRRAESSYIARNTARPRSSRPTYASARTRRSSSPDYSNTVALSDSDREGVIGTAMSRMGTRYRWGGTTPAGFDCSGFVGYVYSRNGKRLPRTASEQSKQGQSVGKGNLKKGDLVFFRTTRSSRVSHVGIYVGEGKFVHASSGGGRVKVSSLSDSYYSKRFAGAKRVSASKGSSSRAKAEKTEAKIESPESKADKTVEAPVETSPSQPKGADTVGR